jgi:outer membrane protein
MKKIQRLVGILALVSVTTLAANAQQLKIGHINSQELLSSMPETDSAQKKLEKVALDHQTRIEEMTVELNKKYDEYLKKMNDPVTKPSDLIRTSMETELQEMQNRIETFKQTADQDIQDQRMALFKPIQDKAVKVVNTVAAEMGFTYILDSGVGVVVYSSPDSQDILPMVKKKLGLK